MEFTVTYKVTKCEDCPMLTYGRSYGNDGRDGNIVYKCAKGAFGGVDGLYSFGPCIIPKVPPHGCPFIHSEPIDRVASKLDISTEKLSKILKAECCKLVEEK